MSEEKRKVGDRVTVIHEWHWQECEYCHLPAKYRVTFLLPDCRTNPASSAYHHDDCTWCADEVLYTCEEHKKQARLNGYELCSIFPLARFQRMGWYKVKINGGTE